MLSVVKMADGLSCSVVLIISTVLISKDIVVAYVSNADLSNFMTSIWQSDVNADTSVRINRQGHTSTGSHSDLASKSLFTSVNEVYYLHRPTYEAFIKLLDNYNHRLGVAESTTNTESKEINTFLTEISKTTVMQKTLTFLQQKGYAGSTWSSFETLLHEIWFESYPRRDNVYDSSGFEHVFVGELDNSEVIGFHNWIQFYLQEKSGNLDYMGYVFNHQPNLIGAHFTWMGKTKKLGSFMYGSSPEFDLAMYTVCFLTRRNQKCSFSLNGHYMDVTTYDTTHGEATILEQPMYSYYQCIVHTDILLHSKVSLCSQLIDIDTYRWLGPTQL